MSMSQAASRFAAFGALIASTALFAACASSPAAEAPSASVSESASAAPTTVTVTDNHGSIEVPVNPERVIVLDNTAMQTLADWDIALVAAPKGVMGTVWPAWSDDASVLDIGNHREPNLEAVVEAEPDLIIGGYRFSSVYDDLRAIQPAIIETNARDGEDPIAELVRQTEILGTIFAHEAEAKQLNDRLETAVASAKSAYDGSSPVIGLITSGGKINYAAPGEGRGVGSLFTTLGLVPGIATDGSSNHTGDEISVEAIAAANPEWLVVLDRDGAFQEDGYLSAAELIEQSEALQNVPAVQKGQIVYLDANFYLTEGIQAYTALYESLGTAFAAAK